MPPRRQRAVPFENVGAVSTKSFEDVVNRTSRIQIPNVNGGDGLMHQFDLAVPFHEQFGGYVTTIQPSLERVNKFNPSGVTDDGHGVVDASSVNFQHTGRTALQTDATSADTAPRTENKVRRSNATRSNLVSSTFRDALPPGFPVPQPSEHKTGDIKSVSAKVQNKCVAKRRPAKTPPGACVFRQRPESRACTSVVGAKVDESSPENEKSESFQIQDAEKVVAYIKERFILLQQQALKKIAKVWIKAICSKKQAKFPYSSSKQEDGQPTEVPPWWPSPELCPHTEPDHIQAHERVSLLLHLLRLRPSPRDLQDWNGTQTGNNNALAFRAKGFWTTYLRDLTPLALLDDVAREPQEKVDRRPFLLNELFHVADLEEQYEEGGNDGIDTITWTRHPDGCLRKAKKRLRRPSAAADEDGEASLTETSSKGSPSSKKTAKTNSGWKRTRGRKSTKGKAKAIHQATPASSTSDATLDHTNPVPFPRVPQITPSDDMNLKPSLYTGSSLNTSFNSTKSTFDDFDEPWYELAPLLGNAQNFGYHEYQTYQRPVQVHSVYNVAQPRFEHTPDLPMVRPMDLAFGPYGAMCPQINQQRIDQGFSALPYGTFRAYYPPERQMIFNGHEEHSQVPANEHERDDQFSLVSHEQGSYMPLIEHQQAYSSHAYAANIHAPAGIPFEHAHDAEWRHPHGGLPTQQQEHGFLNYDIPQILPASGYHNFNGHTGGTGGGAPIED